MSQRSPLRNLTLLIGAAALATLLLAWWIGGGTSPGAALNLRPEPHGGLEPGRSAPPIRAQGWLNGEPPAAGELAGRVVVVEAWATWCGPCWQKAPELVRTYERFRDRGVIFIGLTPEGEQSLAGIKQFLTATGISWPNGYGAVETLRGLEAHVIPTMWVIGRDGKVAWNVDSPGTLADGIEQALAAAE